LFGRDPEPKEVQREIKRDKDYTRMGRKQKDVAMTWSPTADEDF
jgi:hypothetical protein